MRTSIARSLSSISLLLLLLPAAPRLFSASAAYFPFLGFSRNAENPGYVVDPSAVNTFGYNPSVTGPEGPAVSLAYDSFFGDFSGFGLNCQYGLAEQGSAGLSAFLFRSKPFEDWEINESKGKVKKTLEFSGV